MSKEPTPVQRLLDDFAPTLADLTDRVLFGEVWERTELSKRDRSLVSSCLGCFESSRPVAVSSELRHPERSEEVRVDRGDHASGVLCRLAQRHELHHDRKGAFFLRPKRDARTSKGSVEEFLCQREAIL